MVAGFGLDNATTYLALTCFAEQVYETNPIARLEFGLIGLAPSLLINFFMGLGMGAYIATTRYIQEDATRGLILTGLGFIRWTAGLNNLAILVMLKGLS